MPDPVTPQDFGATGDGTSRLLSARFTTLPNAQAVFAFVSSLTQTQDWAGVQAAIKHAESFPTPSEVRIPHGTYVCSDPIAVTRGLRIVGEGPSASVLQYDGNVNCLDVALSIGDSGFGLEQVGILNQLSIGSVTGGTAIRLNSAPATRLNNVTTTNFNYGVHCTGADKSSFAGVNVNGFKDTAFRFDGGNFDIRLRDCVASGNNIGVFAFYMADFNDEHLFEGFITNGCIYAGYVTSSVYSVSQRPEWCRFYDCSFDSGDNGVMLENCADFVFDGCFFSCRPGNGAEIGIANPTDGITFDKCTFFNNGGHGARLGAAAVNTVFDSCNFVSNSFEAATTAHGLMVENSTLKFAVTKCKFHNAWFSSTQNYGLYISGAACDQFVVDHNIFGTGGGQSFVNSSTGAQQRVGRNNVGYNNYAAGSVSLAGGTATVVFPVALAGTGYRLSLSSNADERLHWSAKTASGFTISSSDITSTAAVDWIATL